MGKQIPFPGNFDAFVKKAMAFFQEGNLEQAIEEIQKALEFQMDEGLFGLCLTMMQETGNNLEGLRMLQKYKPSIWDSCQTENLDLQFISFLIQTGKFDEARKQILKRKQSFQFINENQHLYQVFEQNLELIEASEKEQRKEELAVLQRRSLDILDKNYVEQTAFINAYEIFPDEEFLALSKQFLSHPRVDHLLKTEILQKMLEKSLSEEVRVVKGEFEGMIQLTELDSLPLSNFLMEGRSYIQTELKQEPAVKEMLEHNLFLHCAYFYPFEKEALFSVEEWIQVILTENRLMGAATSPERKIIRARILQAEKSLDKLTQL